MLITYTQEFLSLVEHDTVTNLEGMWLQNSFNMSALRKCDTFALNLFYLSLPSLKENQQVPFFPSSKGHKQKLKNMAVLLEVDEQEHSVWLLTLMSTHW